MKKVKETASGRSHPGRVVPLVQGLRGRVSETATSILEQMGATRDLRFAVAPAEMRDFMARRGWVANEHLFEIEALVGGLRVGGDQHLTSCWWLLEHEEEVQGHPELGDWQSFELAKAGAYRVGAPLGHASHVLLDGRILFCRIQGWYEDEVVWEEVVFDRYLQFLEVAALTRDGMFWSFDGTDALGWHRVWVDRTLGDDLARSLGAQPFSTSTGPTCSAWVGEGIHVVERRSEHFFNDTTILAIDAADALAAVKLVLERHRHLHWIAPAGTVSEGMLGDLPRCLRGGGSGIKIYTWGQPSGYWPRRTTREIRWPVSM